MPLASHLFESAIDVIHGVPVEDTFRWLEDRNLSASQSWIEGQKGRYDAYFSQISELAWLHRKVRSLLDAEWRDQPARVGQRLFYRRHKEGQEQACICVKWLPDQREQVLIDPSIWGPFASVNIRCLSRDGSLVAFDLRHNGADAALIHVVEADAGTLLADYLHTGFGRLSAFTNDNRGFYYCHDNDHGSGCHELRLHRLGDSTSNDVTILAIARTDNSHLAAIADESRLLALHTRGEHNSQRSDLFMASHTEPWAWSLVATGMAYPCVPFLHERRLFVRSDDGAPNGRVVEILLDTFIQKEIVPETDALIQQILFVKDKVYVTYLRDRRHSVDVWTLDGVHIGPLEVGAEGAITLLSSPRSESTFFYSVETLVQPPHISEYNPSGVVHKDFDTYRLPIDVPRCTVQDLTYPSSDGTCIPILVVRRADLDASEPRPTVLTSYGGFGISVTPRFVALFAVLLQLGVIIALPSIRGGSEFGRKWHEAARGRKRQTAFQDFIAAAEWLRLNLITLPDKLAAYGASNSGLMVGVALTQRPDLFRAVVCIGPLLDMIRYERFDRASRWRKEFGSVTDAEDFDALIRYSPYHHVAANVNYPSTLFVTGDSDDRCNPAHVRKMAALLQSRAAQKNPILVDYSTERGHHPGLPISARVDGIARRLAFLVQELGISMSLRGGNETFSD